MLATIEDTHVLDQLDTPIRCSQPTHDLAAWGCQPADVATRLMVAPCCGPRAYVCEGRARYYITVATIIQCVKCGRDWPNTRWAFPPL